MHLPAATPRGPKASFGIGNVIKSWPQAEESTSVLPVKEGKNELPNGFQLTINEDGEWLSIPAAHEQAECVDLLHVGKNTNGMDNYSYGTRNQHNVGRIAKEPFAEGYGALLTYPNGVAIRFGETADGGAHIYSVTGPNGLYMLFNRS